MDQPTEVGKTRAIIAHITLIGWIIALVKNTEDDKDEFASYYIRQMLGIVIIGVVFSFVVITVAVGMQLLSGILSLVPVGLWMYSLAGAAQGKKVPTPLVGDMFQDWFKGL